MPVTAPPIRDPASFRDPSGFVFEHGGRILRAVDEGCLATLRELERSGLLTALIDDGLVVNTRIVEEPGRIAGMCNEPDGPAGLLEHDRIEPISYPSEWSPSMLADAGVATLDLQMRLLGRGFSLKDATAYNIQFVYGRPVFIDIPSIERPARLDVWHALGQFSRMFTLPLLLNHDKGHALSAYFLAHLDGSDLEDVRRAFGRVELLRPRLLLDLTLPYLMERVANRRACSRSVAVAPGETSPAAQMLNLRRLRAKLPKLACQAASAGGWAGYQQTCSYSGTADEAKAASIRAFLGRHRPARVLDIGCNTGRYAELAAESGAAVVAVDRDVACVDQLYRRVRGRDMPILPLCVDIANPSPAIGFRNRERPRFLDRVHADCVFALALIHHLHVAANLLLAGIRDLLADVAERYLVLEFVPRGDVMFERLLRYREDRFDGYTLARCIDVFRERFRLIEQVPVKDSPRTLMFWEKDRP